MISSWKLCRFKSVYDKTELSFSPLTLFSGVNNSGKSTVIQSILLTAQTLANPMRARAVSLNGNLVRLGTFNDIVSNGFEDDTIEVGFQLSELGQFDLRGTAISARSPFIFGLGPSADVSEIESKFSFSARRTSEGERRELVQLQPALESSELSLRYRSAEGQIEDAGCLQLRRRQVNPKELVEQYQLMSPDQDDLDDLRFEVIKIPNEDSPAYQPYLSNGRIIGASFDHFVPRAILERFDSIEEQAKRTVNAFLSTHDYTLPASVGSETPPIPSENFQNIVLQIGRDALDDDAARNPVLLERSQFMFRQLEQEFTPTNFRNFTRTLLPSTRNHLQQKLAERADDLEMIVRNRRTPLYRTRYRGLPPRFDYAATYISQYLSSSVRYLAPLRDEPKPVYPLAASSDPSDIGLHGEHTAAVLELNRSRLVDYVRSEVFSADQVRQDIAREHLYNAVLDWMKYMGVVTDIATFDLGNRGHELKVATGTQGSLRDLTHVGVGVSQILPIVVLCLLSPRGSILIFEQPELHLHPRVQSRLADFFLSMTFLGKQCIVETHSEHLINRLRQRSASAAKDEISKKVMMYFVEAESGKSRYTPIAISPYGVIQNWPKGFFDEGEELATAILKAGIRKRKEEAPAK